MFYEEKMKKVALIVETRKHKALPFVLNNVMSILPNDWGLQIFHGNNNLEYLNDLINNDIILKNKDIFLNELEIDSITADDSSLEIMLKSEFWDKVVSETVLYFECDTILCSKSKHKVSEFEKFDYIGGWWGQPFSESSLNETYDRVMNGGLSIRKKSWMIDIIDKNLEIYLKRGGNSCEDYFVSYSLVEKPLVKEVLSFSIDGGYMYPLFDEPPFGLHKPWGVKGKEYSGMYYEKIRQVVEEVDILRRLHDV
tara:strand:- start:1418 stop:2176 length:759 start_codon:yes stop_codon:yes gene_type:complete